MNTNIALNSEMSKGYVDLASSVIGNAHKSDVQIFNNPSFGEIRVVMNESGEPMFCLADLCRVLDLTPSKVAQRLTEDVLSKYPLETAGGVQQTNFVNEDGLYDTILDSRKEEAKVFRKWITRDILPTLRKTGSYNLPSAILPSNPQLAYVQTQLYLADALADRLRLNDASRLGMYQSIAAPYNLALPQYVESKGVTKSAKELLKEIGSPMSAVKFNMLLVEQGYLETMTRPTSGGKLRSFKNITAKGLAYGENLENPKNQKETQPHWYVDRFAELYDKVTA